MKWFLFHLSREWNKISFYFIFYDHPNFVKFWKNRWKDHQTKSFRNLISAKTKNIDKKMIRLYQNFVKAESVLKTQLRIENVKLKIFLYNRKISKINSSTCFCDHRKQRIKYIIISCSLHDRIDIENENFFYWLSIFY